jgi:hypothetical protein
MSLNYVIIPPENEDENESDYSGSSHTTPTRKRQRQDFNYIETGRFTTEEEWRLWLAEEDTWTM